MSSTTICVDANVVVRLVAPAPDRDVFNLWRTWRMDGKEIVAPSLLRFEVTNTFHRMCLAGNVDADLADELLSLALDLPITFLGDTWLHHDALALAGKFDLKASYDAHYVALARHLGAELWTLDKRLYNAVHPHLQFVRLVDNV
jgi:predicted nucleic acid-binding protein